MVTSGTDASYSLTRTLGHARQVDRHTHTHQYIRHNIEEAVEANIGEGHHTERKRARGVMHDTE